MREIIIQNITIKIGENAKENTELISFLKNINENYIWFHLSSFPSPHIIAETSDISTELIVECAKLCKKYSKYKNMKNLYIDYTTLKNIKITSIFGKIEFVKNKLKKIKL